MIRSHQISHQLHVTFNPLQEFWQSMPSHPMLPSEKKKKNIKNPRPFFPRPIDSQQKKGFPLFPQILTWWQGNPSKPEVCVLMETWGGLAPNFGFLLETNPRIFCQMCFLSWVIYYGRIRKQSPNNTNKSKIWNRFHILNPKPFGLVQIIFLFKQVTFRFSTRIFQGCHPKWFLHPFRKPLPSQSPVGFLENRRLTRLKFCESVKRRKSMPGNNSLKPVAWWFCYRRRCINGPGSWGWRFEIHNLLVMLGEAWTYLGS